MAYELAQAYISIIPTTQNFSANLASAVSGGVDSAGESAGKLFGGKFSGAASVAMGSLIASGVTAAIDGAKQLGESITGLGKQAVSSYGEFEQLTGGVEKLFGDTAAGAVMQNAQNAFSTAGMSANEYMENVTSFSASLISGLGGDTEAAAGIADTAIRDMADNANTFGTSMESIQNAYQGFAKGNFTMLDNLKLGYGGTKEEMLRLVNDSGVLSEAVESIDDVSFDQMIEAIHAVQENMNITGTTANEASGTIEGSVSSMQSAWQNLLTGMADENANITDLATNLVETIVTPDGQGGVLGNIIPRIATVITGISGALAETLPMLVQAVVPLIQENLPVILEAIQQALQVVLGVLPQILPVIAQMIPQIVETVVTLLPLIIEAGIQLIMALTEGLLNALPTLLQALPQLITAITTGLVQHLPQIIQAGIQLFTALITNLPEIISSLVAAIPQIIQAIVSAFSDAWPQIRSAGEDLIRGLWEGILNMGDWLWSKISGFFSDIWDGVTDFFGIASPSKKFEWVGEMLNEGLAEGISGDTAVNEAMGLADDINSAMGAINTEYSVSASTAGGSAGTLESLMALLTTYLPMLANQQIVLDSGQLVGATAPAMNNELGRIQVRERRR